MQSWVHNSKPAILIRDHGRYLRLDAGERVRKLAEWNKPVWWPLVLRWLAVLAAGWCCARGAACAGASA